LIGRVKTSVRTGAHFTTAVARRIMAASPLSDVEVDGERLERTDREG
jgi:hypothetical protein